MGYILPINHEQYTQYANRTVQKEASPFKFVPVQKVTLRSKLKDNHGTEGKSGEDRRATHYTYGETVKDVEETEIEKVDKSFQDLTGKGTLFNETV